MVYIFLVVQVLLNIKISLMKQLREMCLSFFTVGAQIMSLFQLFVVVAQHLFLNTEMSRGLCNNF